MSIAFFEAENGMKVELIYKEQTNIDRISYSGMSFGMETSEYDVLLEAARKRNILTQEPVMLGGNMECFFVDAPNGVGILIVKGR